MVMVTPKEGNRTEVWAATAENALSDMSNAEPYVCKAKLYICNTKLYIYSA